jgi:uncharacterized membrane protein
MASPATALPLHSATRGRRLPALDWMRGVVMVLMTVDHASGAFNAGRLFTDSVTLYRPGTPLPEAQFLTRWVTHLCAPSFVFLAGTALALSTERRRAAGESEAAIDRFIVTRGLFIAALDPLWMSWVFAPGMVLLQVLYAIGGSLVAMAALRRLGDRALLAIALALILGGEAATGLVLGAGGGPPGDPPILAALLLTGGRIGPVIVAYPILPWLAMMLLGWVLGRRLRNESPLRVSSWLLSAGVGALALFALVRGLNGYGNLLLLREDGSLVQWLHVSKYPPSLSYTSLELGIMALALGAFFRMPTGIQLTPLLVLGQTALFYYLLHVHVLELAARGLGLEHQGGLAATMVAAALTIVLLYPLCLRYRRYKSAHPDGWAQYV